MKKFFLILLILFSINIYSQPIGGGSSGGSINEAALWNRIQQLSDSLRAATLGIQNINIDLTNYYQKPHIDSIATISEFTMWFNRPDDISFADWFWTFGRDFTIYSNNYGQSLYFTPQVGNLSAGMDMRFRDLYFTNPLNNHRLMSLSGSDTLVDIEGKIKAHEYYEDESKGYLVSQPTIQITDSVWIPTDSTGTQRLKYFKAIIAINGVNYPLLIDSRTPIYPNIPPDLTAPPPATNVIAVLADTGYSTGLLYWHNNASPLTDARYIVQRTNPSGIFYSIDTTDTPGDTTFNITGVVASERTSWRVLSIDTLYNTSSPSVSDTLVMLPKTPIASASTLSTSSILINVSFADTTRDYYLYVYMANSPDGLYTKRDSVKSINGTSAIITNLAHSTTYYFKVSSFNQQWRESALSTVTSATTGLLPPPEPTFVLDDVGNGYLNVGADEFFGDYDSCLVLIKNGSAPANRYDVTATTRYYDTPLLFGDIVNFNAQANEVWYGTLYLRGTNGLWTDGVTDTARIWLYPQLPANFTAGWDGNVNRILINANAFRRTPINFGNIMIRGSQTGYGTTPSDGTQLLFTTDTTLVQSQYLGDIGLGQWYLSLWVQGINGVWTPTPKNVSVYAGTPSELLTPIVDAVDSTGNKLRVDLSNLTGASSVTMYYRLVDYMYDRELANEWRDTTFAVSGSVYTYYLHNIPNGWKIKFYATSSNGVQTSPASNIDQAMVLRSPGRGTTRYVGNGTGTWNGSTSSNPMPYTTARTNINSGQLNDGDSLLFQRGSSYSLSVSGGLFQPTTGNGLVGSYLEPIVWGAYGSGNAPSITNSGGGSRENGSTIWTIGGDWSHVYIQDISFNGELAFWSYTGGMEGIKVIRCTITDANGNGINFFQNPTSFTNVPNWKWTSEGNGKHNNHEVAYCTIQNIGYDGVFFSTISDSVLGHFWGHDNDIFNVGEDGMDFQGSYNLCEYNIIRTFSQTGVKNMPHYNGGVNNEFRGNIVIAGNTNQGGGYTFPANSNLKAYNNLFYANTQLSGFWSGSLQWEALNPPVNRKSSNNVYTGNIWNGNAYVHNVTGTGTFNHGGSLSPSTFTDPDSFWVTSKFKNNFMGSVVFEGRRWTNFTATPSGTINYTYSGEPGFSTFLSGVSSLNSKSGSFGNVSTAPQFKATPSYGTGINRQAILEYFSPSGSSNLFNASLGIDSLQPYTPYTRDIVGNVIPQTGTLTAGPIQNQWQVLVPSFTYGFTWQNNDFLVQKNGYKAITIPVLAVVTVYDSVTLDVLKNGSLFLTHRLPLTYTNQVATCTLTVNIPTDTCLYEIRFRRNGSTLASATGIRVGNAYLISGQSNAKQDVTGYNTQTLNSIGRSRWLETYISWNGWTDATETAVWNYQDIGTSWAIMADSLIKKRGIPVYIQNGAVGGTSISQHISGQYYTELYNNIHSARQHLNKWTEVFWWQGETEGSCASYATNFGTLRSLWKANNGVDSITLVQLAMHSCLYCGGSFFETQRTIANTYSDVRIIGTAGFSDQLSTDNCHFTWNGYRDIGTWLYRKQYYTGYENPVVDSITFNPVTDIVTLYFDQVISYIDTLAIDHDDYWVINDETGKVDTGYVGVAPNTIVLELNDDLPSVTSISYLETNQWSGGGYYKYPFIRNANRVSAILFGDVNPSNLSGIVMSEPSFTATFGSNSSLRLQGSFDTDTDTVRINQKRVSYPINAYSDSVLIVRASSGSLDTTITGSWYNDTTYYFRCTTIGDSSGSSAFSYALDTAKVPAGSGGSGAGDIFNITFEDNSLTGANGFTSTTATTNTFTVVSDTVDEGTYSAKIDPTGSSSAVVYGVRTFTTSGSVYIKGNIWLGHPTTADYAGSPLMFIDDGGGTSLAEVTIRRGTFEPGGYDFSFFGVTVSGDEDLGNTSLTIANTFGQWVEFELNWIKDATSGGMVFKLNGQTVYSELDGNTSGGTAARFVIGLGNMYNTNGNNLPNVNHYIGNIVGNSTAF